MDHAIDEQWCEAIRRRKANTINDLIEDGFDVNVRTRDMTIERQQPALQIAIRRSHLQIEHHKFWDWLVRILLRAGADPMKGRDLTCVQTCIHSGYTNTLWDMIHISKIDITDKIHCERDGTTPAMTAVANSDAKLLELLIYSKVDLMAVNKRYEGVLHVATDSNLIAIILDHLKSDQNLIAFMDLQDNDGNTALHNACISHNVDVCKQLIKFGADTTLVNLRGNTLLHQLVDPVVTATRNWPWYGHQSQSMLLYMLLGGGISVHQVNTDGNSCLHLAVIGSFSLLIYPLLAEGAKPDDKDLHGRTCFHLAVMCKDGPYDWKPLDALLDHRKFRNGNLEIKDNDGLTTLLLAAQIRRVDVIDRLCEKGADVKAQDRQGNTALALATRSRAYLIVNKLLEHGSYIRQKKTRWTGSMGYCNDSYRSTSERMGPD